MEIKILESSKNRIKFELIGSRHTLGNILTKELWNDKDTSYAGYQLAHPQISNPILILETNKSDPKKALLAAIDRLKKKNKELVSEFKQLK